VLVPSKRGSSEDSTSIDDDQVLGSKFKGEYEKEV
jgi:hypothetical protein